jgi:hypothetical protein
MAGRKSASRTCATTQAGRCSTSYQVNRSTVQPARSNWFCRHRSRYSGLWLIVMLGTVRFHREPTAWPRQVQPGVADPIAGKQQPPLQRFRRQARAYQQQPQQRLQRGLRTRIGELHSLADLRGLLPAERQPVRLPPRP